VLTVARQFAEANNLEDIYITPTDHGSISNRREVQLYMEQTYMKLRATEHLFQEATSYSSNVLYRLPKEKDKKKSKQSKT
jgi:hypothetical protein